jgi:hypothetical protein
MRRRQLVAGAAALTMATAGFVTAGTASAEVASCTVNVYMVTHTPAGVFDYPDLYWIKDKRAGDTVTGPNSNVMPINYGTDWRKVYLANRSLGLMYRPYLRYERCY